MVFTLLGRVMPVIAVQPKKALLPMVVTPLWIVIFERALQSWNAHSPMVLTLPGIVMLVMA